MPRGNPNIKNYSPIVNNTELTEDENKNYLGFIQESFNAFKPDLTNTQEINKAIELYVQRCNKHNIRLGNMGFYNALGLTRQEVNEYLNGRRKAVNPDLIDTLKKIKSIMAEYREALGSHGKINPVTLVFWQKNHDNFEDVQKMEFDTLGALNAEKTPQEIAKEIESDIPIDADYIEK